jgi:hypothetical protein
VTIASTLFALGYTAGDWIPRLGIPRPFNCEKATRRLLIFTNCHAQKCASRPASLAYSSVILTRT